MKSKRHYECVVLPKMTSHDRSTEIQMALDCLIAIERIHELETEVLATKHAYRDAFDPNKTKALLIGEWRVEDEFETGMVSIPVDWTTIKEIQRAILEQAQLNMGHVCSGCGSDQHILTIRDRGVISCCPDRKLVPPLPESDES